MFSISGTSFSYWPRKRKPCIRSGRSLMEATTHFSNNASQWETWRKDPAGYARWVKETISHRPADRSHGFRFLGQYEQQVPGELETARNP